MLLCVGRYGNSCAAGQRGRRQWLAIRQMKAHLKRAPVPAALATPQRAHAVLTYWFGPEYLQPAQPGEWEENNELWWGRGPETDQEIKATFTDDIAAFASGVYDDWLNHPYSGLAGVILGDQLSRHIYRGTPQAFAFDPKVLVWSRHLQDTGMAQQLPPVLRSFIVTAFSHSEELEDQQRGVKLATAIYEAENTSNPDSVATREAASRLRFAEAHRDVIARWGRFPHRNKILGRQSTPEEDAGLANGSIGRW